MFTVVSVDAYKLRKCLQYLAPMFPKGTTEITIGLNLSKGKLTLTCTTGCVLQAIFDVDSQDTATATVIYYTTIGSFLPGEKNINIEFLPTGVILSGDGFEVTLPMGYSTVTTYDFGDVKNVKEITTKAYQENLNTLLSMNLDKLYSKVKPVTIYENLAVIKYPNTWVQTRSTGLSFVGSLDPDHVKLLCKFEPKRLSAADANSLWLQNDVATLRLPCNTNCEENNFASMLDKLGEPVTVSITGFVEKLRNAAKCDPKGSTKIALYPEGFKASLGAGNVSMSIKVGDCSDSVIAVMHIPTQMLLAFTKAMGSGTVQILYGGDLLCLRNQSMVILTRVVP